LGIVANTAYYQPSPFEFEAEEIRYFLDWKHYSSHQLSLNPLLLRRRYSLVSERDGFSKRSLVHINKRGDTAN
ncbi:hypothetical protein ACU7KE_004836, partial [Escherichia coli]|nr:hypothetical protein [Escherichia coli]